MMNLKNKMDAAYCERYKSQIDDSGEQCCPFFEQCKESLVTRNRSKETVNALANNEHSFRSNYNAHIGTAYGVYQGLPKIVFIGKENISEARETKDTERFEDQPNTHYRGTRDVLAALLGKTDNENLYTYEINGQSVGLHTLFALTNHYHCTFRKDKKVRGLPHSGRMWYNCVNIVKDELDILKPDILVIQAGWSTKEGAEKDIEKYFASDEEHYIEPDKTVPDLSGLYWLVDREKNKKCCIIGSYHPACPLWYKDMVSLNKRIEKAKDWFFTQNHADG